MKILIWIGCFIVATILNTLLGYATGIKAGYLLFYIAVFFVAKKLCSIWDNYRNEKEASKNKEAHEARQICKHCGAKLPALTRVCPQCGKLSEEIG